VVKEKPVTTNGHALDDILRPHPLEITLTHPGLLPPSASHRLPWSMAALVIGGLSLLGWGAVVALVIGLRG
jgi:hypothetical protein